MSGKYDDIIHLPHHVSSTRPQMPLSDRAAQFAPFAALRGYEAAVQETARRTEEKRELTEDARQELDAALRRIRECLPEKPQVRITWFVPDPRKDGGAYITHEGAAAQLLPLEQLLVLEDGTRIGIGDIAKIEWVL